eukprot:scaffold14314_cov102-Skeletonema_marinoi.AAC.1
MSIICMHLHNQRKWHSQPRGPASQFHSFLLVTGQIGSMQRAPFDYGMRMVRKVQKNKRKNKRKKRNKIARGYANENEMRDRVMRGRMR